MEAFRAKQGSLLCLVVSKEIPGLINLCKTFRPDKTWGQRDFRTRPVPGLQEWKPALLCVHERPFLTLGRFHHDPDITFHPFGQWHDHSKASARFTESKAERPEEKRLPETQYEGIVGMERKNCERRGERVNGIN